MLVAYTYSKAMDNASSWGPGVSDAGEQINPINPRLSRSLSAFDLTHNFVVSYSYMLPFDKFFSANKLTRGWMVTGITRYATGFPVTINEQDDNSLLGTFCTGPTSSVIDTPNFTPSPFNFTDPRWKTATSRKPCPMCGAAVDIGGGRCRACGEILRWVAPDPACRQMTVSVSAHARTKGSQ